MEAAFRAALLAVPAVAALGPARVSWGAVPQGAALPAVSITRISGAEGMTMRGRDGLTEARVQVDAWADDYEAALAIARAVERTLHGHRAGGLRLVAHAGTRDDRAGGSNEAGRPYRQSMDFIVHWRDEE